MIRLAAMAAILVLSVGNVSAQTAPGDTEWPSRPIRLIVPFPAGASTDIVARIVAQKLGERPGQQIVIENRAGASGNLGADAVAKAAPDGYTIGVATASTHTVAPNLNPNLPYDPIKDFKPISLIGSAPYVLVVYPGVPARNVAELISLARSKPGALNYATAGPASLAHLASALFASMAGVDITHVPYKSSSQSVTDMVAGRIEMQFATIAPSLPLIRENKLRALATTGKKRLATLSDFPTLAEAGLSGYEATLWFSFVAPAATPSSITERMNRAMTEVLNSAEIRNLLAAQGVEAESGPPEALTERIRTDIEKWRNVIAKVGIRTE